LLRIVEKDEKDGGRFTGNNDLGLTAKQQQRQRQRCRAAAATAAAAAAAAV
jgi:hypothetical protein